PAARLPTLQLARAVVAVPAIGASGRELAQLVSDHRLGDEHGHVLASVVHGDRVSDELREDGGRARPGLQHPLLLGVVHLLNPLQQLGVHERPLLARPAHRPPFPLLRDRTMSFVDAFFLFRVRYPSVGLPHGVTGCDPLFLPSPPPSARPSGFEASGSALPAWISTAGPDSTVWPTRSRVGARM